MAKDGKKTGIIVGLGAAAAGILLLVTRAKAAPPPEPEPGLANLYGKVTNAVTGQAIVGVEVTLDGMETLTNGGGNYAFTDLAPGGYVLQFSKTGYETAIF